MENYGKPTSTHAENRWTLGDGIVVCAGSCGNMCSVNIEKVRTGETMRIGQSDIAILCEFLCYDPEAIIGTAVLRGMLMEKVDSFLTCMSTYEKTMCHLHTFEYGHAFGGYSCCCKYSVLDRETAITEYVRHLLKSGRLDICVFMNRIKREAVDKAVLMTNPLETFNALALDVGETLCTHIVNRFCAMVS